MRPFILLGILFTLLLAAIPARAGLLFLPATRHQQYQTYALFTEEQISFIFRNQNRAWAAIAGDFALAEAPDWFGKPQVIVNGSVATSFLSKGSLIDFNVETFDARFALLIEMTVAPEWRVQWGVQHNSGHTSDGLKDLALVAPNLGQDQFQVRVLRDFHEHFRVGATFAYLLDKDPETTEPFNLNQFAEYFPLGAETGLPGNAQPYLAVGLEEYGTPQYDFTYHAQVGLLFGKHFQPEHQQSLRLVLGYYHGVDPRLKYAVFLHSMWDFFYGGVQLNL